MACYSQRQIIPSQEMDSCATNLSKLDTSTLKDFSARLCRFYKFPHGTQVILWDKKKNRKVRDDCLLKHTPVNKKTLTLMPSQDCTIAEFLRDYVESLLQTVNLKTRGHEIRLQGPDDRSEERRV